MFLRKTSAGGESLDYHDYMVLEKLSFENVFRPHGNAKPTFSNSSGLNSEKSVFERAPFS